MWKVGIALIGPSGTGKTTIGRILAEKLEMRFHDMDDEWLESEWWVGWVARVLREGWDDGFLEAEWQFVIDHYGRESEGKKYLLDDMMFATSGSLVLEVTAMKYIRERMIIVYLDLPDSEISSRAHARGVSRIVGMNGESPRFQSVEEVLQYRRGYYEKYADITYPLTIGNTPEDDAEEVWRFLEQYSDPVIPSLLSDSRSDEYISLRRAIITSQPTSGGLWCPRYFPQISLTAIESLQGQRYQDIAKCILGSWSLGISEDALSTIIEDAYGLQWHNSDITPVKHIAENLYSLHLGYGPTFAFKNIALEFLPRLLSVITAWQTIHVLGASSGDTINAAHSGVKGTNIRSLFMLPTTGPSTVQRLQAISGIRDNPNAFTLLADASFDPLQDIVKKINSPEYREFKEKYHITSFNSINIARILAQTVYYFRAYAKLLELRTIQIGEKISFSVPSGNFWDALAGYYAMRMWLPIDRIHIATNENDMLHIFFQTGRYAPPRRDGRDYVAQTNAPSMDIAKSSNFERILYDIVGGESHIIDWWYRDLGVIGYFQVDASTLAKIRMIFTSSSSTDTERLDAIRIFGKDYEHGIDPHTAAAVVPWIREKRWNNPEETPLVFLETSHIAQFSSELANEGIDVPSMHEFDDIFHSMSEDEWREWENYLHTGSDFGTIFPDIERVFEEIFPEKFY
jgi:threonine synthase